MINVERIKAKAKADAKKYLYSEIPYAGKLLYEVYEMGYWDGRSEAEECSMPGSFKKCVGSSYMRFMDDNMSELVAGAFCTGINVILTLIEDEKAKNNAKEEK